LKDVSETTSYRLKIEGGTIRNTATGGNAICNASYGSVNISGGYIYTNGGVTVFNAGRGEININDGTVDVGGTNGIAVRNETGFGKVNINGGKVKAAGQGSRAVYNNATGEVNISGGEVSSHNWIAVVNYANGKINVSGTALITSANTNATSGSIFLFNNSVDDNCRLEISGGTIENTSAAGNAIRNESNGSMEITGGKVLARNGFAINNNGAGLLTIGNNSIVFAYGSAATDVVSGSPDPTGDAVIAAWNMMHDKYDFGSDQDIIKLPATAITVWKKQGGKSGISVKNGLNTGFIPVPGVTVKGEIFIVSFAGEGINIPQQEIEEGDLVICPPDPERPNYDFNGWFTDNGTFTNEWDFDNDGVTQNMTLYAKWTPKGAIAETGNDAMRIYPNPTTGEFRISPLPLRDFSQRGKKTDFVNGELKIENVEIFNVMGQSIGANLRIYPNNTINISHLPTGVYFVKITTDSGVVIRKVIKSEL